MQETPQQESLTSDKYVFGSFPLWEHKTPEFREKKGVNYIYFGETNDYTDYLIYLYNRSSIHSAIVNGKTRFILGGGWEVKGGNINPELTKFINNPNPNDSMDELTQKSILDRKIFGGYALRVIWMNGKIVNLYHQPFQTIRTNADHSCYFISNEWTRDMSTKATYKSSQKIPDDMRTIAPFDPTKRDGEQLLYITDYRPQTNIYPLPEYRSAIASIETQIEISNYFLTLIKSGFSAGHIITLYNGKPSPEEAKKVERQLKNKFTGTDNAGEVILNFAEINEKEPSVTPLRGNDLDKQYEQMSASAIEQIIFAHNISSPMLFGLKTEGQLGGRSEMDIAWNLFTINYVEPNQKQIENEFNYILNFAGFMDNIVLQPLKKLNIELSEQAILNALSKDEIRQIVSENAGLKTTQQLKTDDLLTTLNSMSPLVANKILSSLTTNQILGIVGLPPIVGGDAIAPTPATFNDEFNTKLITEFSKIGVEASKQTFADVQLSPDEQAVVDYLKKKSKVNIAQATRELKVDVQKIMNTLIENNVVVAKANGGGGADIVEYTIKEIQEPNKGYQVKTYYEYAWVNPSDASSIDRSREFCQVMMRMGKRYTKAEIDNLDNTMRQYIDPSLYINGDTSIWTYRGGWYTMPNTNGLLHTPSCRHYWKQVQIKEQI
jgi:hypothetical protein